MKPETEGVECEWYGMEAPGQKISNMAKSVETLEIGEWYMIADNQLPITSSWLGEDGRFTHQGPYKILAVSGSIAIKVNDGSKDIDCLLGPSRFKKCNETPKAKDVFKVGDWIYAEQSLYADECRDAKHIPVFQLQEITSQGWLRPEKNKVTGVREKYCRLATPEEIPQQKGEPMEYKPQVGEWIIAVTPSETTGCKLQVGKAYRVNHINDTSDYCTVDSPCNGPDIYFKDIRKARPEEIPVENFTKESLEEAKERYPVGTTYRCAGNNKTFYTVETQNFTALKNGTIWGEQGKGCLKKNNKWAEIVSIPAFDTEKLAPLTSFSTVVIDFGDRNFEKECTGIEKMPKEIIVKRKEKIGKRFQLL
jgi:hypothetical protein